LKLNNAFIKYPEKLSYTQAINFIIFKDYKMSYQLTDVSVEDFSKIGGEKASYLKIEDALIAIGGTGVPGVNYKKEVLKAAGWHHGALTSYLKHAEQATEVFNKIKQAIDKTTDKDALLSSF
jgi:hypothetical protein